MPTLNPHTSNAQQKNNTSHPSRKPEAIHPNFPSNISKRMCQKQLRVEKGTELHFDSIVRNGVAF
jgi:hypothetical protein